MDIVGPEHRCHHPEHNGRGWGHPPVSGSGEFWPHACCNLHGHCPGTDLWRALDTLRTYAEILGPLAHQLTDEYWVGDEWVTDWLNRSDLVLALRFLVRRQEGLRWLVLNRGRAVDLFATHKEAAALAEQIIASDPYPSTEIRDTW